MKKFHKANLGFVAGVALLGYGAGLVSVQPSNAEPKDGRGFGGGPTGPGRDDDDRGPRDDRGPGGLGGPGGPGGGRGMRGGGMIDGKASGPMLHRLLEDIDLSDNQLDRIQDVQEKERAQMDAIRKQMEEIQKKSRSSIDNILTADQRKQLEKAEKEMAQNDPRGGGGRGPGQGRGQGGPGRGGPGGDRQGGGGPRRGGGDDFDD